MISKKIKVYCASGWFSPKTREILDELETRISKYDYISLYSPRRDGIVLPPEQKHDTTLRESIFRENIQNIDLADVVIANIDSRDSYNDPGTVYEIGYAMAHNVPVVGFSLGYENIESRFKGILSGFDCLLLNYADLDEFLSGDIHQLVSVNHSNKVLFIGAGDSSVDEKIASLIMDSGASIRWVNELHTEIYPKIDEIFKDVEYMIAVIDDRKTLVSWMIGQAYARGVPVITYSDHNWGINVMLLVSVLTHLRGTDELNKFLQQVKREGLYSIPKFDISQMDSM